MHNLIVGNSTSGKSELAKAIARTESAKGHDVIVYDPLKSKGWPENAIKFSDPKMFLLKMEHAESAFVFVDEAKTLFEYDESEANKLLYKRRHQGLMVFLIAQRTRMVPPNARNQCSRVFVFRQQKDDSKTLGEEYTAILHEAKDIPKLEFIASDGFDHVKGRLDFSSGKAEIKLEKSE